MWKNNINNVISSFHKFSPSSIDDQQKITNLWRSVAATARSNFQSRKLTIERFFHELSTIEERMIFIFTQPVLIEVFSHRMIYARAETIHKSHSQLEKNSMYSIEMLPGKPLVIVSSRDNYDAIFNCLWQFSLGEIISGIAVIGVSDNLLLSDMNINKVN